MFRTFAHHTQRLNENEGKEMMPPVAPRLCSPKAGTGPTGLAARSPVLDATRTLVRRAHPPP
jgi:hypothetical protein